MSTTEVNWCTGGQI